MAAQSAGLIAAQDRPEHLDPALWPAIVLMANGQAVVVLSQQGATPTRFASSTPTRTSDIALSEFLPLFSGTLIRAEAPVAHLGETHAGIERRSHRFRERFGRFHRHFAGVALGSFVANLLADAVALFSPQVHDRVIPKQSQATLRVLAAEAAMALVPEAFPKVARAQLLDSAGRQIAMGVQTLPMQRRLGMRSDQPGRSPAKPFSAMLTFWSQGLHAPGAGKGPIDNTEMAQIAPRDRRRPEGLHEGTRRARAFARVASAARAAAL